VPLQLLSVINVKNLSVLILKLTVRVRRVIALKLQILPRLMIKHERLYEYKLRRPNRQIQGH